MKAATLPVSSKSILAIRLAACLWCHERAPHGEVIRNQGLCHRCAQLNAEFGWRVVYDRDNQIGSIPRNLRDAYGL
jgi:hypothetical protein